MAELSPEEQALEDAVEALKKLGNVDQPGVSEQVGQDLSWGARYAQEMARLAVDLRIGVAQRATLEEVNRGKK